MNEQEISVLNALKELFELGGTAASSGAKIPILNSNNEIIGSDTIANVIKAVANGAKIGFGYGECTTAATTAAKAVTLSDFALLKGSIVSVCFKSGVSVADATLNINSTGAKAIYIKGVALQPNVIRPMNVVAMQYDGTRFNIISILGEEVTDAPDELWVDMGLPSGLKWAKKNIDISQADGFAASEYQYECSFVSWGNTQMHNPTSSSSFGSYSFGSANDQEPYASSPGAAVTGHLAASQDAARVNLGAPWRMPTTEEYKELFDNCDFIDASGNVIASSETNKLVTMNSIVGIRLKSRINGKILFFPCSGYGNGSSWYNRGSSGNYWSGSLYSATNGRSLSFYSGGVNPQSNYGRFYGFAVRPVQ